MGGIDTEAILKRRDFFPRGLVQPEGGYRFSLDSLLLASFAHVGRRQVGVDLGCGCGPIALGLLLRQPDLHITGVELNPDAVWSAEENRVNLHFIDKLTIVQGDVADWRPEQVVDFVLANPPYRALGKGKSSQGEGRETARFEAQADFATFARCAAVALKTRGKFFFVHLPERLPELMADLAEVGLMPKRMCLVHGRADETAKMVLMETMKAGGAGLKVEPPLIMHSGKGKSTRLTEQALEFCPFLACNTGEEE
ncbi:tRNA1(Val) (adenine(37)-N6)-methyltransferase [Pseudodesulfovibrio sediminis]|uniref:SAM-dependent methyltransferase n=1 Tax=Pseudodesulfovibrio sediminis TaxID=2810563 RepID=A0ABN6EUI3_9BACT|nr:methyltransferase [Pseudodesulfovibrio sediminis]BCS88924.1 SAM-dependent methyltransferase [Pseudodesulfovibrio sediminis]